jgi:tetratricopeptide (TPR) repeat protein
MVHGAVIRWLLLSLALFRWVAIFAFALPASPQEAIFDGSKQGGQAEPLPSATATSISNPPSGEPRNTLGDAMALARRGDWDSAIKKYQQLLEEKPKSPDGYAGLAGCYLRRKDVAQAYETVTKGLQVADAWPVRVALGEVYFRQGKIHEAEKEWVDVINSGHQAARAYLGLARVRWAISMNKSAKAMIEKAHALDPHDRDIQTLWIGTLPRSQRIEHYQAYLADASNSDLEERINMEKYLSYLKEEAKQHRQPCRLVSRITNTQTPLVRLLEDPTHLRGYGLAVILNGTRANIMLDTGASGIVVKRRIAEKAGIAKLTETNIWGVGDRGPRNAFVGTANSIRIGELEFQDCPVEVIESRSVAGEDGLIGADVFEDFLVDINFPEEKLKLSELPKRPGEGDLQLALKNDDSEDQDSLSQAEPDAKEAASKKPAPGPQDRYIAPEMRSFTPVYRFGHHLLVPTRIGEATGKLFMLDTGALNNAISPAAAREVAKVRGDSDTIVTGVSGRVQNVYSANKAVLQFGHLRQENQDMLSFDTTGLSDASGTEISGFLGFVLLRFLDIKIDYRDALVDFSYDAKRFNR